MELQIDKAKYFNGWEIKVPAFTSWGKSFIRELRFTPSTKLDYFMDGIIREPRIKARVNDNGDLVVCEKQWLRMAKILNKPKLINNSYVYVNVLLKKGKNKWRKL